MKSVDEKTQVPHQPAPAPPAIVVDSDNRNSKRNTPEASARARARWRAILAKFVEENADRTAPQHSHPTAHESDIRHNRGLIEEIRKAKERTKVKESVLSVLKTQANLTQKQFERQKYSAKEILIRKRSAHNKGIGGMTLHEGHKKSDYNAELIAEYAREAQLRYPITPEIQVKLDKIKAENDAEEEKMKKQAETGETSRNSFIDFFAKMLGSSILGQTLMANPRFYKIDPHEHLPELCRRCRRPLIDTLESRFTIAGILFCIFFPFLGIFLLYANREFVCVVCEEIYVYGDLTARPEEDYEDEEDVQQKH